MGLIRSHHPLADPAATVEPPGHGEPPRLDDPDPQRRREALHACEGQPERLAELVERLALETDAHVRSVLIACLVDSRSEVAARALVRMLEGEDVAMRNLAIEALTEMPEAAMAVLPPQLSAADADVRIFAVQIIGAIGGPQAAALLGYVLANEEHVNVVDAAINGIVEIGGHEHIQALLVARRRFAGNPYIAFAANAAIAALGSVPLKH